MDLFLLGQSEGQRERMIVARRKRLFNLLFREREREKGHGHHRYTFS
jgi:hypothetical protein